MLPRSSKACSSSFGWRIASPSPMFRTIFSTRGHLERVRHTRTPSTAPDGRSRCNGPAGAGYSPSSRLIGSSWTLGNRNAKPVEFFLFDGGTPARTCCLGHEKILKCLEIWRKPSCGSRLLVDLLARLDRDADLGTALEGLEAYSGRVAGLRVGEHDVRDDGWALRASGSHPGGFHGWA